MAQQQDRNRDQGPSAYSPLLFNAQMSDMMDELGNSEAVVGTGPFVPMGHISSSTTLVRTSTGNTPVASPSLSSRRNRMPISRQDSDAENTMVLRRGVHEKYHYRTLNTHNIGRMAILPLFPTTNVTVERVTTGTGSPRPTSLALPAKKAHLLLSNVPVDLLNTEQYARVRYNTFPALFQLKRNDNATSLNDSFLLDFYQELYVQLKQRLKVDIPILDFNLARLRQCASQVAAQYHLEQTMLNIDELASALEFYLQIDVDMFFLKTCSFNGVQPRLFDQQYAEGLFCLGTPVARFTITPCEKPSCHCCHSPCPRRQTMPIQFSVPCTHRFVNQYEAILNCPATCESKNSIYVLTCPCGQFDFIAESKLSFAETLAGNVDDVGGYGHGPIFISVHREEGNRIIREYFFGERNIEYLTQGLKSEKKKTNDQSWLYQHSARCSVALQFFLDYNPEYWCFVPMKSVEQQSAHGIVRGYLARQPVSHRELPPPSDSDLLTTWHRKDADVRQLLENQPAPPFGYSFTPYQRQQQANFFKWAQDRNVPLHQVDLYNANIIAILPDNVSKLFRKTIESLLITHAECKLNQTGHLLSAPTGQSSNINPNRSLETVWCVNLTRQPTSA